MELSLYDLRTLVLALNDREGVLSTTWEMAQRAAPYGARATAISAHLKALRELAARVIAEEAKAARSPA